jgi:hypothetical protein
VRRGARRPIDCLIATFCIAGDHALRHSNRDFDPSRKRRPYASSIRESLRRDRRHLVTRLTAEHSVCRCSVWMVVQTIRRTDSNGGYHIALKLDVCNPVSSIEEPFN